MITNNLEMLRQIDPNVLAGYVRQDQGSHSFELLDWTVNPMSHDKIIRTTGGLYRFTGQGVEAGATRPWSIVLKILNDPRDRCQDRDEWCYWKRELLAFESGMLNDLPDPIRVPRCYGVTEHESSGWIWMEEVASSVDQHWSFEHYHYAARQAGRFAGAYLGGSRLPDQPWLSASFLHNAMGDGTRWAIRMDETSPSNVWQNPVVQQAFDAPLRSRVLQVWAEKQQFFNTLAQLPQVLCHNDFHRRNLMIGTSTEGAQQLIALDWAFCGVGAIGADLGELVGGTIYYFEMEPAQIRQLEETALMDTKTASAKRAGTEICVWHV